jgi:hypothetical protein
MVDMSLDASFRETQGLLKRLNLEDQTENFVVARLDDQLLKEHCLTDTILREAGIPVGARRKILKALPPSL